MLYSSSHGEYELSGMFAVMHHADSFWYPCWALCSTWPSQIVLHFRAIAFHPYIYHNLVCCWFAATWTFVTCIMESTVDLPSLQLASHAHCAAVVHTGLWHVIHVPCSILYICYDARVHLKRQLHKVDP